MAIKPGDAVLYKRRGCDSYELGIVKARNVRDDCLFEFENAAGLLLAAHFAKDQEEQ